MRAQPPSWKPSPAKAVITSPAWERGDLFLVAPFKESHHPDSVSAERCLWIKAGLEASPASPKGPHSLGSRHGEDSHLKEASLVSMGQSDLLGSPRQAGPSGRCAWSWLAALLA